MIQALLGLAGESKGELPRVRGTAEALWSKHEENRVNPVTRRNEQMNADMTRLIVSEDYMSVRPETPRRVSNVDKFSIESAGSSARLEEKHKS